MPSPLRSEAETFRQGRDRAGSLRVGPVCLEALKGVGRFFLLGDFRFRVSEETRWCVILAFPVALNELPEASDLALDIR